jgi:hypothetical protein
MPVRVSFQAVSQLENLAWVLRMRTSTRNRGEGYVQSKRDASALLSYEF